MKFSIWYDMTEHWTPDDVPEPNFECEAESFAAAAQSAAVELDGGCARLALIVRNDDIGVYYSITLRQSWSVVAQRRVALEALCAP